ncbi:MAG: DUF2271 domain-containing protein [Verrucomicrobiota bacterium]
MKKTCLFLTPCLVSANAGEIKLSIEVPRLDVAEYHRPYVAAWLEKADKSHHANLAVWYDTAMKNEEGEKWLKDLRQWWRKSGRVLNLPMDGMSGPTRPAGTHDFPVPQKTFDPATLAAGDYALVVEASREVGGREMVRVPFKWDGKSAVSQAASGKTELGKIAIHIESTSNN